MCGCVHVWMCPCIDVCMCRCVSVHVWMCGCVYVLEMIGTSFVLCSLHVCAYLEGMITI